MTRELTLITMLFGSSVALAQPTEQPAPVPAPDQPSTTPDPYEGEVDDSISKFRAPLEYFSERMIGKASKPIAFNWRRSTFMLAATGGTLFELNNFASVRGGLMVRAPIGGPIIEISANYVGVWDTPSSRLLALTPYRQPGRPNRVELDLGGAFPIAEGVATAFPKFMPALQMVFNFHANFRYILYPTGWAGMRPGQVGTAIFSPTITEIEVGNLDNQRLTAMQVDSGRYSVHLGLGNDIYSKSGFFLSPRFMLAVPILAPATNTELRFWADFSLNIGQAF